MHRKETNVETDKHQPESPTAEPLGQRTHTGERRPVIKGGKQWKHHTAEQHIMEVGDNEITVMDLPIERDDGHHDPRQSAQHKDEEKTQNKQHGHPQRTQANRPRDSCNPGKYLYAGWHRHRHTGGRGKAE